MKYLLLMVRSDEEWESLSEDERDYGAIMRWWGDLAERGVLLGGEELQPARTATTISWAEGGPIVTDGPFIEAKESVGGYGVLNLPDLDAAIEVARSWPARGHRIEIRPVVQR